MPYQIAHQDPDGIILLMLFESMGRNVLQFVRIHAPKWFVGFEALAQKIMLKL